MIAHRESIGLIEGFGFRAHAGRQVNFGILESATPFIDNPLVIVIDKDIVLTHNHPEAHIPARARESRLAMGNRYR